MIVLLCEEMRERVIRRIDDDVMLVKMCVGALAALGRARNFRLLKKTTSVLPEST